jgi:hypothetical protein
MTATDKDREVHSERLPKKDICGWGDLANTASMWSPCGSHGSPALEKARAEGFLTGGPPPPLGARE